MAKLSKKKFKELNEKLARKSPTVWDEASPAQRKEIFTVAERYKSFLDESKTERLAVETITRLAKAKGFKPLDGKAKGKKFFMSFQNKTIALAILGKKKPSAGLRILGAHIDCPRLDLKMHPLYENTELAFLKTHYYGGVKKYQWLARPMAIHGVVCTKAGKSVSINIGDAPGDPVFSVLDLLPHLARKVQGSKKIFEAIEGERMNLLVGALPVDSEEKGDKVKLAVLQILDKQYGITEEDLISAELEIVPAGQARDVGLDRAMVGSYGQDDRACSFASLEAALNAKNPEMSSIIIFTDKEEIGSDGSTSAKSRFFELVVSGLMEKAGEQPSYMNLMRTLASSQSLSTDVNAGFDPDYPEVHEKLNAAYIGHGVGLTKYTGSGGKYAASDANAEFMAWIRRVWDDAKVVWQAAGMGKIDEGGGGTIAKLMAIYGMEIVDAGPPLLSMHSPFEIGHKADIWSACKAFEAFLAAPKR